MPSGRWAAVEKLSTSNWVDLQRLDPYKDCPEAVLAMGPVSEGDRTEQRVRESSSRLLCAGHWAVQSREWIGLVGGESRCER